MRFKVNLDVFNGAIFFFIGKDEKEKYMKASGAKDLGEATGQTHANAIWLEDKDDLETLVHEIHHAKHFMVELLNINDEETEACILSYVFREAMRKLKKC